MKKSSFVAILMVAFAMLFTSSLIAEGLSSSNTNGQEVTKGLEGNSAQDVGGEWLPD